MSNEEKRCPIHDTPMWYSPHHKQHACQDLSCRYAHGLTEPREIEGWSVSGTDATERDSSGRVQNTVDADAVWDVTGAATIPEAVVAELLRARGWTVGGTFSVRMVTEPTLAAALLPEPQPLMRERDDPSAPLVTAKGEWADAPSPESLLAARILAVLTPLRQLAARTTQPSRRIGDSSEMVVGEVPVLVAALRAGWAALLRDPDEITLAEIRETVERAERLVREGT